MIEPSFDPVRALAVLARYRVDFVVIGGYAGTLLGAPLMTNDVDICYDRQPENLERLAAALRQLGARLPVTKVEEELPFLLDAKTLAAGDSFPFLTDVGSLDVLGTPSGTAGYRDLAARARTVPIDDFHVLVVALADLARMKRASGRAKDRAQLEILAALAEELEADEGGSLRSP